MKKLVAITLSTLFAYAAFAQGYYFEMKMSSPGKGDMGNFKAYSQDGNNRSEINMTTPVGPMNMVSLILKSTPNTMYKLNDKNKTYTEVDITKSSQNKDYPQEEYEVTVIGKEKVNGYNSIHVKVTHKGSTLSEELWTSKEVIDYSSFLSIKTKITDRSNLNKALQAKDADGFPVRVKTTEKGMEMQMDLIKAEKRNNPSSMFSLDGYTKSAGTTATGQSKEDMIQKMQDMTPEERQKFIDEMKSQYGKQPK